MHIVSVSVPLGVDPTPVAAAIQHHRTPCSCARNDDGTVTTFLCPVHADVDPCLTMSSVTGRRRTGSIRNGKCSHCGHRSH